MGKYFGTDGFRGEANKELTAAKAFKVGRYIGWYYVPYKIGKLQIQGFSEPATQKIK